MSNQYWLKILMVDGDDYGDKTFKFYYELYKGKKQIWSDYTVEQPSLKNVLNSLEVTNNA